MKDITTKEIKSLRDLTGVSVMQCKGALEESGGDMAKAILILKKKSSDIATKKGSRELGSGTVASYIHSNGNIGAMVLLSCETDFVAKNEEFKMLAYDIAMQVTATNPEFLSRDNIGKDKILAVREILEKEMLGLKKDKAMLEKILDGKVDGYFKDKILTEQTFIKDESLTVKGLIEKFVQKFGERIEVARISRFSLLQ